VIWVVFTQPMLLGDSLSVGEEVEQGNRLVKREDQKYWPELDMSVLTYGDCR